MSGMGGCLVAGEEGGCTVRSNASRVIYLSSVNRELSILTMRHDGQKRKIIRKMCI